MKEVVCCKRKAKTLQTSEKKFISSHSECCLFSQYLYGNEQVLYALAFPRCWYATKHPKNKPQSIVAMKFINLMINLDECKKILKNNNTDEVKMIREYLYLLANLQIESENNSLNVDSL